MTLSAAQLEMRRGGIGSSEIAAVAGVHPYSKPIDIWLEKTGQGTRETNALMELGTELEPFICRRALRKLGLRDAMYCETKAHPRAPWMMATPDFLLPERPRTGLECKNVGYRVMHHWTEEPDDRGVPLYYLAQVQQQMEVWDLDEMIVAALIGGRDDRVYEIRRDREVGEGLIETSRAFWFDHVLTGVAPPVDGSKSFDDYMRRRFGRGTDAVVEADAAALDDAEMYREACVAVAKASRLKKIAEQKIKERMGTASVLEGPDFRITWKEQAGKVSWAKVAKAVGATDEQIEAHRGAASRRFLPPRGWADEEDGE